MKTIADHVFIKLTHPSVGKGLFAVTRLSEGDFIAEYSGKRIPTTEADTSKSRYLFEIDKDWTVDAEHEDNFARYINHSCDPNCEADIRNRRVLIFALRDIENGEELTLDYGEEYFDEFIRPIGCKCSSCTAKDLGAKLPSS
jgi:SET domain-containing protein